MFERQFGVAVILTIVLDSEPIAEWYDENERSYLLLGFSEGRPIHVVVARRADATCIVVTVYQPDPKSWTPDFKRRQS